MNYKGYTITRLKSGKYSIRTPKGKTVHADSMTTAKKRINFMAGPPKKTAKKNPCGTKKGWRVVSKTKKNPKRRKARANPTLTAAEKNALRSILRKH